VPVGDDTAGKVQLFSRINPGAIKAWRLRLGHLLPRRRGVARFSFPPLCSACGWDCASSSGCPIGNLSSLQTCGSSRPASGPSFESPRALRLRHPPFSPQGSTRKGMRMSKALSPASRRSWHSILYVQVLLAIALAILLGYAQPKLAVEMKPLGDAFIKL